jgi:DNA-binding NtrC family response regulator
MEAINGGELYRYITKPFEKDNVRNALENVTEVYQLGVQNKELLKNLIISRQDSQMYTKI